MPDAASQVAATIIGGALALLTFNVSSAAEDAQKKTPAQRALQFADHESRKAFNNVLLPLRRSRPHEGDRVRELLDVIYDSGTMALSMGRRAEDMTLELLWSVAARNYFINVQRAAAELDGILYTEASADYFKIHDVLEPLVQACKKSAERVEDVMRRRFAKQRTPSVSDPTLIPDGSP